MHRHILLVFFLNFSADQVKIFHCDYKLSCTISIYGSIIISKTFFKVIIVFSFIIPKYIFEIIELLKNNLLKNIINSNLLAVVFGTQQRTADVRNSLSSVSRLPF